MEPLTAEACAEMAAAMRDADRLEMSAMLLEEDTEEARLAGLISAMNKSHGLAKAAYVDDQLVMVWGVLTNTVLSTEGHPWLIATDRVGDPFIQRAMAVRCRAALLAAIPAHVTYLWNLVHDKNVLAIRWLRWMGFKFQQEPIEHGGLTWFLFRMEGS